MRFYKKNRNITIECWPRQADPRTDAQYEGWPVTINQRDNFLKNASWYLPELTFTGGESPVVQVINEQNDEVVYTLRVNGTKYLPRVLKKGNYTIIVSKDGSGKKNKIEHLAARKTPDARKLKVSLK